MKNKEFENFCSQFVGYKKEKKELLNILNWYKDKSIIKNKNVELVNGILFYGPAGCGKTTILREYSKCFDCKIYNLFNIELDNVDVLSKEIIAMFESARKEKFAIILIDEIDSLMINKKLLRIFQEQLDGLSSNRNVLFMAATNLELEELPKSLLRSGRFDRKFRIGKPSLEDRKSIIEKYLNDFNISHQVNLDKISIRTISCSCVDIKAIINDAYLRYKNRIDEKSLNDSYIRIKRGLIPSDEHIEMSERECVNHASKILIILINKRIYDYKYTKVINNKFIDFMDTKYEKGYEEEYLNFNIDFDLAGIIGEKIIYGHHDIGNVLSFDRIHRQATVLVEKEGFAGVKNILNPYFNREKRYETDRKNERITKCAEKIISYHYKHIYKYLKKHTHDILSIAELLKDNNEFNIRNGIRIGLFDKL